MMIIRRCPVTGSLNAMNLAVTMEQMMLFQSENRPQIQDIFPQLTDAEREYIKTGITPANWEAMFRQEEARQELAPSVPVVLRGYNGCNFGQWCYNTDMEDTQVRARKKRSDRTHIVYMLVVDGQRYVGVTAKTANTVLKSVRGRAAKHFYRAHTEGKDWKICVALRQLGSKEDIDIRVLAVVRGKSQGHQEEVRLRRELKPELNTDVR